MKILAVRNQELFELGTLAQNSRPDHLHDSAAVRRSHAAESLSRHEHELLRVYHHDVLDVVTLRLLIAVILGLTIVPLRLDEVLDAELVSAESDRVAVRYVHAYDELEIADRRVLGAKILALQPRSHLRLHVIVFSHRVLGQELDPLPVD